MPSSIDRRILFILMPATVAAAISYQYFSTPTGLAAFIAVAGNSKYHFTPQGKLAEDLMILNRNDKILINREFDSSYKNLPRIIYLVNAVHIINDKTLPYKIRKYYRSNVFQNGISFPCLNVSIVDLSALLDKTPFLSIGPQPHESDPFRVEYIYRTEEMTQTAMLFVILHESGHLILHHYNDPTHAIAENYSKGVAGLRSNNFAAARMHFREVLRRCPAHFESLDNLAVAERHMGNLSVAERLYKTSIQIEDHNSVSKQNLIGLLIDSKKIDMAKNLAISFYEGDPKNPEFPYFLGLIALFQKDYSSALKYLKICRDIYKSSGNPSIIEADILLLRVSKGAGNEQDIGRYLEYLRKDCDKLSGNPAASAICSRVSN